MPDFCDLYRRNVTKDKYTLEDVFDECVSCELDEIIKMRGIDILYSNMSVHMRVVVDGVDKPTDHHKVISSKNFVVAYEGSTAVIHLERFLLNESDEYWEYYIAL